MCGRDHFHSHWGRHHHGRHKGGQYWKHKLANWGYPPVNVEELDDQYLIRLYAAGYQKSDFQVKLQGNLLIIAVDNKAETERDQFRGWARFEFQPGNFRKEFELNDKIEAEAIAAKYEEGILTVSLPKLEGHETLHKDIGVA